MGFNLYGENEIEISFVAKESSKFGMEVGDIIIKLIGKEITWQNQQEVLDIRDTMKVGDEYEIVVRRDSEELTLTAKLLQRMDRNVLEPNKNASKEQLRLREVWMKNLPL